jgi:hypothetical protein
MCDAAPLPELWRLTILLGEGNWTRRRSKVVTRRKSPIAQETSTSEAVASCWILQNALGNLASQSIPSWNQIVAWLGEMETLRRMAA